MRHEADDVTAHASRRTCVTKKGEGGGGGIGVGEGGGASSSRCPGTRGREIQVMTQGGRPSGERRDALLTVREKLCPYPSSRMMSHATTTHGVTKQKNEYLLGYIGILHI